MINLTRPGYYDDDDESIEEDDEEEVLSDRREEQADPSEETIEDEESDEDDEGGRRRGRGGGGSAPGMDFFDKFLNYDGSHGGERGQESEEESEEEGDTENNDGDGDLEEESNEDEEVGSDSDRNQNQDEESDQDREAGNDSDGSQEKDEEGDQELDRDSDSAESREKDEEMYRGQGSSNGDEEEIADTTETETDRENGVVDTYHDDVVIEEMREVFDDEEYDEDAMREEDEDRGEIEKSGQPAPVSARSQRTCLIYFCLACVFFALIGGAVIGAILADSDSSFRSIVGIDDNEECRDLDPDGPLTAVFTCPEDNVPLEFRIVFDARPGEVGVRVTDDFGISMWNFPERSFGSFALLLRENIFTLCLSPFQNYTFEVTDSAENGFISIFGAEIFGSFSLLYADEVVTTYNGDCNATTSALECGIFCKCSYLLAVNASSGQCTTECEEVELL